jgi:sulfate transport system ATP-binding protein
MSIVLERLVKTYASHVVVNQVSLEIANGELFVLLGASGTGKSTILRMIAGLTAIDSGRVLLHDRDVTMLRAQERGVGFVFQNYALFRHMTVAENVEFALAVRKTPADRRRKRREDLLELVGLSGLGNRLPSQLSGGQQQRVALARALAHEPAVLLLDEPFGALDALIRSELRRSLLKVHRELGVTTIFVTHDQDEAFELADRIGIMHAGRLLEVGTPKELYLRPRTEYVASFLGSSNLMVGELVPKGVRLGPVVFPLGTDSIGPESSRRVQVLFRPEDVAVKTSEDALGRPLLGKAIVEETSFSGSTERLRLRLPRIPGVRAVFPAVPFGSNSIFVDATRPQDQAARFPLKPGDPAWVALRRIHALPDSGLSILVLAEDTPRSLPAMDFAGKLAKTASARLSVLACGEEHGPFGEAVKNLREQSRAEGASMELRYCLGPALHSVIEESARRHFDLLIRGMPERGEYGELERELSVCDHHVMAVPGPTSLPKNALVCVAVGEPGKEDIRFAGRLLRHLGARATITCVLPDKVRPEVREQVDRFMAAGETTLSALDVPSRTAVRKGSVRMEILEEFRSGEHDLLILGAPLPNRRGIVSLDGFVGDMLGQMHDSPVLIVRSHDIHYDFPEIL